MHRAVSPDAFGPIVVPGMRDLGKPRASAIALLVGVLPVVSCGVSTVGLPGESTTTGAPDPGLPAATAPAPVAAPPPAPPTPPPAAPAAPPPAAPAAPPPAAPAAPPPAVSVPPLPVPTTVLRARQIKAERIVAGVVFARKLDAKSGTVTTVSSPLPEAALEAQIGEDDVKMDELRVDVLYADDIQARSVLIRESHVLELRVRDRGDDGDD
jgi:hypothetical protein